MFRNMRRFAQNLTKEDAFVILDRNTHGVLALSGDDGYPYAVPMSYARSGDTLYFHSAASGHKLDAIAREPKASFCVVDRDEVVPERYTTYYRSAIAFGRMRTVDDAAEARAAIELIGRKYSPHEPQTHLDSEIDGSWRALCVLALDIEHLSGKQAKELMK